MPRRTVFLNSPNKSGRDLAHDLGQQAGDLVGDDVKTEVWYRAEHQLGVTVNTWGEGLLVIASCSPTEAKPDGIAMAILSTYGLTDDRLAELTARWRAWWTKRFPDAD